MLLRKKEEIEIWLKKYKIKNYKLIEDTNYGYVINVKKGVDLRNFNEDLKKIEVKFNKIYGDFDCAGNKLKSLEGCPEIVEGNFDCSYNELETLKGCPKIIEGIFWCNNNNLLKIEELYLPKELKTNKIYLNKNKKLDKLQEIRDLNNLIQIIKVKEEKDILLNIIEKENLNKNNNINKV